MNTVEATLWSGCPVPASRVASYSVFMVTGSVPFTPRDLQALWDEWRKSDLSTHVATTRQLSHPLRAYAPPTDSSYNRAWLPEREKFYNLFSSFLSLDQGKTTGSLFLIYPDGKEIEWSPRGTRSYTSTRGPSLAQAMKSMNHPGEFGLAVTSQYLYNDPPSLYEVPPVRSTAHLEPIVTAMARTQLVTTASPPLMPTMTDEPLPLSAWRDFWILHRNNSPALSSKYGTSPDSLSSTYTASVGLYRNPATGISDFFDRVVTADASTPADKVVMGNLISDAGFQYALVRIPPSLRSGDAWEWFKLPSTPGTQYISSMAPAGVRMVVKGLYVEP